MLIKSHVPLESISAPGSNLYEWSAGKLTLINLLPAAEGGLATLGAQLGYGSDEQGRGDVRHAISDNGSRVFWSANGHLYVRRTSGPGQPETLRLDGVSPEAGQAVFQTASADGSMVFFTDTQPLTEHSGAEGKPDLYACEVTEDQSTHQLGCALSDLTPARTTAQGRESAELQGTVLGASEDGTSVYFLANGVLSEAPNALGQDATPGHCREEAPASATCNLYLARYDAQSPEWQTSFVASLSGADAPDWTPGAAPPQPDLGALTSRVSPNGRYLAFMSQQQSLTGYDNEDATSRHARERWTRRRTSTTPAEGQPDLRSCDPSGARPDGSTRRSSSEGPEAPLKEEGCWSTVPDLGRAWLAGSVPG